MCMSTNASNDETPRTTYPIPAELLEDAFEGDDESERDNEARLSHEWQEEQNSARHEDLYGCDDEGYDCPEWDDWAHPPQPRKGLWCYIIIKLILGVGGWPCPNSAAGPI